MIARIWRGETPAAKGDKYLEYLQQTGLKDYRAIDGNRGVYVLRQDTDDRTTFLLLSLWESVEAMKGFAGPDYLRATYYPEDDDYLLKRTAEVELYSVEELD
ncbi:MAG: antibiotic biosynthesis monooxygenase [Gaiellaceae bacterium]